MINPVVVSNGLLLKNKSCISANNDVKNVTEEITNDEANNTKSKVVGVPKSYIKIVPSFHGDNNIDEKVILKNITDIAERREIEEEIKRQNDLNNYLWAKSWDEESVKAMYSKKAANEIAFKDEKFYIFGGIRQKSKEKIKDAYFNMFLEEKKRRDAIMTPKNIAYCQELEKNSIKFRFKTTAEILNNTKGTIKTKLAGYEELKRNVAADFILPVTRELLNGGQEEVKNSMLLYGPTGCGKTVAAEAIANETYCNVDRIKTNTRPTEFPDILREKLGQASVHCASKLQELYAFRKSNEYKNMSDEQRVAKLKEIGSPRTVILIDEFDRYFNPRTLEPSVIQQNIGALKTMFDGCAKLPIDDNINAPGVTFICTTNYPERIPMNTDINQNKMKIYNVDPPYGEDMISVINYYIEKAAELIKEQIVKGKKQLVVPSPSDFKFDKLVEKYGPYIPSEEELSDPNNENNPNYGAFSNDSIGAMVMRAAEAYIDNPSLGYNLYLVREFHNNMKDIRPNKLKKYKEYIDKMEIPEKLPPKKEVKSQQEMSEIEIIESQIESLIRIDESLLTKKQKEKLAELRLRLEQLNNN